MFAHEIEAVESYEASSFIVHYQMLYDSAM